MRSQFHLRGTLKPQGTRRLPRFLLLIALTLASAGSLFGARKERSVDTWQPVDYKVSITLNDTLTEITKARAEITIQILRDKVNTVDLDFGDLPIDAVSLGGRPLAFERSPSLLNIRLAVPAIRGSRQVIVIDYHGRPKDGLILTADKDGKPSATGDNWPDRVHHWIPCFDHPSAKATVTFIITAPARDLVVANGKLADVRDDARNTRTWTYAENAPIPAYCMVIAVGEFAKSEPTTPAITPLAYFVPQSDANRAVPGFVAAAPSLKFFSETVAPYPYEKLALIVGATRFGGMENSSAIVFPGNLLNPRNDARLSRAFNINESLEEVVAHEIAHQWFGDSVTESTWADLWLSEGFATYFAGLVLEKYDGEEAFHIYMSRAAESYFRYEKQTLRPIHDTETEKLFDLLNPNNYQKGAWVLHMLRAQLGDEAFFRGVKLYYNAHKGSTANSDDLRAALEKSSKRDLREFFSRWVYGTGHPRYELTFSGIAEHSGAGGTFSVTLKQLQAGDAFLDPVPFEVTSYADRGTTKAGPKRRLVIQPNGKITVAHFHFDGRDVPNGVQLDPDDTLLKEVLAPTHK